MRGGRARQRGVPIRSRGVAVLHAQFRVHRIVGCATLWRKKHGQVRNPERKIASYQQCSAERESYSIRRYARKIHGRVLGQFESVGSGSFSSPYSYSRELPSRASIPLSLCYPGPSRNV